MTHVVAFHQVGLGAQEVAGLQIVGGDLLRDGVSDGLGSLRSVGVGQHHVVGQQLARRATSAEVVALRLEVLAHAAFGQARVAREQGVGELGVGVVHVAPGLAPEGTPVA